MLGKRPVEQASCPTAARQRRVGPVSRRRRQKSLVQQEVLAREARERFVEHAGGPHDKAHGLLAVTAQRVRRARVLGKPQAHGLEVSIGRDLPLRTACAVGAGAAIERDVARTRAEEGLRAAQTAHARELEALRAEHAERETALRAQIDQAAVRLEGVQKRVMLQTEEARDAQRRAEASLAKTQQRNEQLVGDVQRLSADAAERRRLAERHEKQLASAMEEARELRRERDALVQQVALLHGQVAARTAPLPPRTAKRSRQST